MLAFAPWLAPLLVAPVAYGAGIAAESFGVQAAAGCLAAGVLFGPHALGLVPPETASHMGWVEKSALALVALAGGLEVDVYQLGNLAKLRQSFTVALCVSGASWFLMYNALDWMLPSAELTPTMTRHSLLAAATLGATLLMGRSPASGLEAIQSSPACALLLCVVVLQQALLAVCYSLNVELATYSMLPSHACPWLPATILAIHSLMYAGCIGLCGAQVVALVLRPRPQPLLPARYGGGAPPAGGAFSGGGAAERAPIDYGSYGPLLRGANSGGAAGMERSGGASTGAAAAAAAAASASDSSRTHLVGMVLLGTSSAVFHAAAVLAVEPLLATFLLGVVLANNGNDRADKLEMLVVLSKLTPFANAIFYGLVGATLRLTGLSELLLPAVTVGCARALAIALSCCGTCSMLRGMPGARGHMWRGLVSQSGLGIALARATACRFPEWGPPLQTLLMLVTLSSLLLGAPLLRSCIPQLGIGGLPNALLLPVGSSSKGHDISPAFAHIRKDSDLPDGLGEDNSWVAVPIEGEGSSSTSLGSGKGLQLAQGKARTNVIERSSMGTEMRLTPRLSGLRSPAASPAPIPPAPPPVPTGGPGLAHPAAARSPYGHHRTARQTHSAGMGFLEELAPGGGSGSGSGGIIQGRAQQVAEAP